MNAVPQLGTPTTLPVSVLVTSKQIRRRNGFDAASIRDLAASIMTHGLMQPLVVEQTDADAYTVVAGHRRLRACLSLNMNEIPVIVRQSTGEHETRAAQAVENIQRVNLALLDRAEGVAALVQDVGAKEAARLLSKSPAWISKHVALTRMHLDIQSLAEDGTTDDLEVLGALKAIRKLSPDKFDKLAADLRTGVADRASVRKTLEKLRASENDPAGETPEGGDEGSADLAGEQPAPTPTKPLKLTADHARRILAGIVYANQHKPSSRPGQEVEDLLREFVKANFAE
jgi:ParB family chromosome partitioning protein